MGRTKRWARIAGINVALLAAVALAAELVFGGWVGGARYGALVIPRNFQRTFDVADLYGGPPTTFKRDGHGLRGAYGEPSTIDILTIGGSTTNELFVTEGATWSDRLGQAFAQAGRPMVVVNAGVDGQSTVGHLKNFELWFPKIPGLKPRYILAYIGINDAALSRTGYMNKQDHMVEPLRPWKRTLMNNSALYILFRNLRGMARARDAKLIHTSAASWKGATWMWLTPEIQVDRYPRDHGPALAAYALRVKELAARIRALGAEPILVTQAMADYRIRDGQVLGIVGADGLARPGHYVSMAAHNRAMMAACAEAKAVCVDLGAELEFGDGDHYDDLHTTPQGSAKIGRFLYEKLKDVVK